VKLLLEAGASADSIASRDESLHINTQLVDAADKHGSTPLMLAAEMGHTAVVKSLLKHGANVLATDEDGTVRVFRQKAALEDAISTHVCSLQMSMRVTNAIPLGVHSSYWLAL
jgi:ankyrin repeat protein